MIGRKDLTYINLEFQNIKTLKTGDVKNLLPKSHPKTGSHPKTPELRNATLLF